MYFFSAVQGTVWYAAHVVAAGLAALYLLFALEAERPVLAGTMLALGFATRTPLLFAAPLFVLELARTSCRTARRHAAAGALGRSIVARFVRGCLFAMPIALVVGATFALNAARFGDPFEVGYRYLRASGEAHRKVGAFQLHYFGRNLAVVLTSVPGPAIESVPFASRATVSPSG